MRQIRQFLDSFEGEAAGAVSSVKEDVEKVISMIESESLTSLEDISLICKEVDVIVAKVLAQIESEEVRLETRLKISDFRKEILVEIIADVKRRRAGNELFKWTSNELALDNAKRLLEMFLGPFSEEDIDDETVRYLREALMKFKRSDFIDFGASSLFTTESLRITYYQLLEYFFAAIVGRDLIELKRKMHGERYGPRPRVQKIDSPEIAEKILHDTLVANCVIPEKVPRDPEGKAKVRERLLLLNSQIFLALGLEKLLRSQILGNTVEDIILITYGSDYGFAENRRVYEKDIAKKFLFSLVTEWIMNNPNRRRALAKGESSYWIEEMPFRGFIYNLKRAEIKRKVTHRLYCVLNHETEIAELKVDILKPL